MKNFKSILAAILFVFLSIGCSKGAENEIAGSWYDLNDAGKSEMLLLEDGTVRMSGDIDAAGTYTFPDDKHIRIELGGVGALVGPMVFEYSLEGEKLIFTDSKGKRYVHVRNRAEAKIRAAEATSNNREPLESKTETPPGMTGLAEKLSEGYTLSAGARLAIAETYQTKGTLPHNLYVAGLLKHELGGPNKITLYGKLTPEITLDVESKGTITLAYPVSGLGLDKNKFPSWVIQRITPTVASNNSLMWSCSVPKALFSNYREWLPNNCSNLY